MTFGKDMLTDFLVALPEEADAICAAGGEHWKRWPCVTLKNIDPVKLASLGALLTPQSASKKICGGDAMLCEAESGEAWVFSLPKDFVSALAESDASTQEKIGVRWTATEELIADGFSQASATEVIASLSRIAKQSIEAQKAMLVWMCL